MKNKILVWDQNRNSLTYSTNSPDCAEDILLSVNMFSLNYTLDSNTQTITFKCTNEFLQDFLHIISTEAEVTVISIGKQTQ